MGEAKGDRAKIKASKEQRAAAAAERRRGKEAEIRQRRERQLQMATAALRSAEEALSSTQARIKRRDTLANHLETFYEEVDKLTKGNRHLEATPLIVAQANDVVRDAKDIVEGDSYLDRVKEFVPAGENPVYPDVLMVSATVQAALRRAQPVLEEEEKRYRSIRSTAGTIAAAVRLLLETGDQPSMNEVRSAMGQSPSTDWFYEADDAVLYFDIDRLDDSNLDALFVGAVEE